MILSLAEEFTEPFDLERYKNGEEALFLGTELREFLSQEKSTLRNKSGTNCTVSHAKMHYKMRPLDAWVEVIGKAPFKAKANEWEFETVSGAINLAGYPTDRDPEYVWSNIKRARRIMKKVEIDSVNSGWIPWGGGECPIPWAKAGEFNIKYRSGLLSSISAKAPASNFSWGHSCAGSDIVAFCLTNGWIYCNGKTMPEEIKVLGMDDRIEFVTGQGKVESGKKKSVITWFMHTMFAHENIVAVRALKKESIQDIDSSRKSVMERPELMKRQILEETPKQIATRQAYTRYKAKHAPPEPYVGLRDGEIEEIAGEALAQMKPWWRK